MKTIIISDLHNRVSWVEKALASSSLQPYDKVIFLGDYFDNYNDTKKAAEKTALWLKQSLQQPNRIHLIGTHDLFYMYPHNEFLMVSGNSKSKARVISKVLDFNDIKKLYMFAFEQQFLISHAGVHTLLINDFIKRNNIAINKTDVNDLITHVIEPATTKALFYAVKGQMDAWIDAGYSRRGFQPVGGIIWLDWNTEFEPVPHINQIVGHTEIIIPDIKFDPVSVNFNIDTKNKHIGIIENGLFSVIETKTILGT